MRRFETTRRVRHSAKNMFDLVSDVERYPEFVPLCAGLRIKETQESDDCTILICDMTAAYKSFGETFGCQVTLEEGAKKILVKYLDGPFRKLENIWRFEPLGDEVCNVKFFIEYEFRSRALQLVAGAVFDHAFRKFAEAFETRANKIYGINRRTT